MFPCRCGDDNCLYAGSGYLYCRPCEEHHRNGECAIDEEGRALAACGHPWFMCEWNGELDTCVMKEEPDGLLRERGRSEDDVHEETDTGGDRRREAIR